MPPRKDLGTILVDEDVLEAKDLERVRERRPVWSALLETELVTADQIFRALSVRLGVPVVSDERLAEAQTPESLRRVYTRNELTQAGLLPVELSADGKRVTAVMVDPSDEQTLTDFLKRARLPEGRALLGRRDAILRAIERVFGDATAVVTPLPPARRTVGRSTPVSVQAVQDDDVTGTVSLDPSLQAEISRLPARMTQAEPLTPLPRSRPRRSTPPQTPSAATQAGPPQPPSPPPQPPSLPQPSHGEAPRTPDPSASEALRAEERLTRALVEVVEALASELEARIVGGSGAGAEMARLARRVARQLGLGRRAADEIGVAAQLFALDRAMRNIEGTGSADVFAELGWAAAGEGGLLPVLRALTAASSGFGRGVPMGPPSATPIGTRIIGAVADYLELGAAATAVPDLDTVSQLLRASAAGTQVVDALLRVLESDRGDKTPATPTTLPATSMLREPAPKERRSSDPDDGDDEDDDQPTPPPTLTHVPERSERSERSEDEKTQRKPYPSPTRKEGSKGE